MIRRKAQEPNGGPSLVVHGLSSLTDILCDTRIVKLEVQSGTGTCNPTTVTVAH